LFLASAVALLAVSPEAIAQQPRKSASRAALEEAAMRADQTARTSKSSSVRASAKKTSERIRARLKEGDFQPGHRILLAVYGDSVLSDTFTVRADRKLILPNLPPMSLVGVLDSELEPFLTKELATYVKNPTVRAQGLLRVAVLGSVGQPGFYSFPLDFALSDVIMEAGGPDASAEVNRTEIRRGGEVAVNKEGMQEAFRLGLTLNDVGVRPGDQVVVRSSRKSNWGTALTVVGVITGLAFTVSALAR
jgi:protein involved in polysaccharide export with SLBB domain